jgi:hypothetical protein
VVDSFLGVVKREIPDEATRDRIARSILALLPAGTDEDEAAG